MNKLKRIGQAESDLSSTSYLEYIQKFKELTTLPNQFSQLDSGVIIIELFLLIKGFIVVAAYEQHPKTFSHKFANLKVLLESIEKYWNQQLQSEIESKDIDIVQIGKYASATEIQKLLELFVKTAARSQDNQIFIERILQTSRETQQFLKKIIEQALNPDLKESPRKEKEKRMIDRLIQLDHQNQKLQQVISTICDEKYELQMRLKATSDSLTQKTQEILRLQAYLNDQAFTPQKKRIYNMPDTSDRKDHQIDSLKQQLIQTNIRHEKEIQQLINQIERLAYKAQLYDKVKGELELSQSIIHSNQEIIEEIQRMENILSQQKAQLMNKENVVTIMRDKLQRYEDKFISMEKAEMELKAELERKTIQLAELSTKIDRISPRKSESIHHNLYLQFPEIINTQADAYMETNKVLREQLERSRNTLERTSAQLSVCQAELDCLRHCEAQNKKLRELIIEQKSYKGEEIDMLVHALYHLQKQMRESNNIRQRALKVKNS